MTTIAYRNGVMSADSRVVAGHRVIGSVQKVFRVEGLCARFLGAGSAGDLGAALVGVAGRAEKRELFMEWIEGRGARSDMKEIDDKNDFEAIIVFSDTPGTIRTFDISCVPVDIEAEFYGIGSGAEFALGAMEAGAGPESAVEIAIRRDVYSGGAIQTINLGAGHGAIEPGTPGCMWLP